MLFSIIVPVYNAADYLDACIRSVLGQSCRDFELILVDDGSTDASADICRRYAAAHPDTLRYFAKENGGQFSARMFGVGVAAGEYAMLLDADDCLHPDAVATFANYIAQADSPDILFCGASTEEDYAVPMAELPFPDGRVFVGTDKTELYRRFIVGRDLNAIWAKAYKMSLLKNAVWDAEKIGALRNGEDVMQNLPLFTAAEKIVYCKHILYFYRQAETSITHRYSPTFYHAQKTVYEELRRYIGLWGLDAAENTAALDRRFLHEMLFVAANAARAPRKMRRAKLAEICGDGWFRDLYRRTDKRAYRLKTRVALALAYHRALFLLGALLSRGH